MKKFVLVSLVALLLPTMLCAQPKSLKELTHSYSTHPDVEYVEAGKAIIWMIKAKTPKGAMDGVKLIDILAFKADKAQATYAKFRSEVLALYEREGIKCVKSEKGKDGLAEVYMEEGCTKLTEYSMFISDDKGNVTFMRLEGEMNFPAPKSK